MDRVLNMILRMFVRQAVRKGVNAGLRAATRGGPGPVRASHPQPKQTAPAPNHMAAETAPEISPEEQARRKREQQAVREKRRAKKAIREARRARRM